MSKPFRWNIFKHEQLGSLLEQPEPLPSSEFIAGIQQCCVRVLSQAGDSDLIFIGRSPENLFDYLSGILADTAWAKRCTMVNISIYDESMARIRCNHPTALPAMYEYLTAIGLTPHQIAQRSLPISLIDLVCSGGTFGALLNLWLDWAAHEGLDAPAILRRLNFVGITIKQKPSPNTLRWQQEKAWTWRLAPRQIRNVSLDWDVWAELGNNQPKYEQCNPPWRWADATMSQPPREAKSIEALNLASYLYRLGCTTEHRQAFAHRMSAEHAMRYAWFRSLGVAIRRGMQSEAKSQKVK
ncbi:hypothetical protein ACP8Y2_09070 [Herpetosiphon llansteffanensis]